MKCLKIISGNCMRARKLASSAYPEFFQMNGFHQIYHIRHRHIEYLMKKHCVRGMRVTICTLLVPCAGKSRDERRDDKRVSRWRSISKVPTQQNGFIFRLSAALFPALFDLASVRCRI